MKTSEKTTITVSIKDMIIYLLSRWRVLIIWLLIGAVAGGAYSAYKNIKEQSILKDTKQFESLELNMSETDRAIAQNSATTIIHYLNQFDYYSNYDKKSIFQKLNPDSAKVLVLSYFAEDVKDNITADSIASVYGTNIIDDRFAADVAEAFGISEEEAFYYYDGIIRISDNRDNLTGNKEVVYELPTNSLKILVYGEDDEFITKMAELVKTSVKRIDSDLSKINPEYKISLLGETIKKNNDTYIYNRQDEFINNRKQVVKNIDSLKEDLSSDILRMTQYLIMNQYKGDHLDLFFTEEDIESGNDHSFNISKKWVILGAAGFLILAVIAIIIKYLLMGVIRCYDDIEYTYGIQVLGTYDDPKTASREHKFILDKFLKSLRIKRKSQDRDSSVALIAKKLQLLARNHDIKNICVAIGPDVDTDDAFINDVIKKIDGIKVTAAYNILRNADAINMMLEADGVVLLEQMDRSRFSSIDQECVMCSGNNIMILGAIVAE